MEYSDSVYNGQLIDEYYRLNDIKKIAAENNDAEVVEAIDEQMKRIKIKLQPLELPED